MINALSSRSRLFILQRHCNMAALDLPSLPPQFKPIQHYLKTAAEHDKRDPVVAYYCRLYATQRAMEIDKKSPEARTFIVKMMDVLENYKKEHPDEATQNEVVGQAHMEHYALQIFLYADNEDRAGRFGKNVVKSFYTASMLMDVLSTFGELSEDIQKNQKYAKWKAAYIHKCLKDGVTPVSGPLEEEGEEGAMGGGSSIGFESHQPQPGPSHLNPNPYANPSEQNHLQPSPASGAHAPPTTPADPGAGGIPAATQQVPAGTRYVPPSTAAGVQLQPQDYQSLMKHCKGAEKALQYQDTNTAVDYIGKGLNTLTNSKSTHLFAGGVQLQSADYQHAMKYCKYAGSALQYQDSTTAIDYLTKALNLLTTGKE